MARRLLVVSFSFIILLASLAAVSAMQPITVPLEVRNNTNGILNNTQLTINFTFFDERTAGTLLYNETQTLITDSNGRLFPIINTTGLPGNVTVWLEINISNQMITPRFRITGSLYAENAERLQNQTRTTGLTLGNISLQGNITHTVGGLLINSTGGINASAVGFGSIPQGVLDAARFWTAAQVFVNTNFTGAVNVTSNIDTLGASIFAVRNQSGAALFRVGLDTAGRSAINFMAASAFNITLHNSGSFVIRQDAAPILDISYPTGSGSIISLAGTVNVSNLTAGTSPTATLLINNTGGINASAVGFGFIPQGVLDVSRNWTAGQIFGQVNLTGRVNISAPVYTSGNVSSIFGGLLINETGGINASAIGFGTIPISILPSTVVRTDIANTWTVANQFFDTNVRVSSSAANPFMVRSSSGSNILTTNATNPFVAVAIGNTLLSNDVVFAVAAAFANNGPIFSITTANQVNVNATLNITNRILHDAGGILINSTGGINASAVGFGTIPQGVTQVYNNTGFTGGRVVFGRSYLIKNSADISAEVLVNLSIGFSCTECYVVTGTVANNTATIGTIIARNMNASQFNITVVVGASDPPTNISWTAVGY